MRILRTYGAPIGTVLIVLGFAISTILPERRAAYLSVGGFGLLLLVAGLVLDRERVMAVLTGRRGRAAGASAGYVVTVLAVLALVNYLGGRHHLRLDTTENAAFSLSEQTVKVLKSLPRSVTITAFYRDGEPARQRLEDLLDEYAYHTSRLTIRYIDPDKNPGEVKRYGVSEYGTIVMESGDQESRVMKGDEEALTNGLIKVTSDRKRIVYVTTGHGEHDLSDSDRGGLTLLKEALERQHYVVSPLVLSQGVPADASLVLIPGPGKPFLDEEVAMIREYLDRGGRALFLLDPGDDPGFGEVLSRYGLAVRDDVVIDQVSQLFGGDAAVPMVPGNGYDTFHPVTETFRYQTFYPFASSIEIASPLPDGAAVTALARTSEVSWGESSEEELESGRIRFDEGEDVGGPVTIAAAATLKVETPAESGGGSGGNGGGTAAAEGGEGEGADLDRGGGEPDQSRLILFGDSDFVTNAYFNAAGNGDLSLNAIAWLAEREELVSIRPKTSTPRLLVLSPQQVFYYFWTIVAVAPVAIAAVGVGIWLRRKRL
ncbi:MAG: GldG family protein [Acidobacteriota bacterium]